MGPAPASSTDRRGSPPNRTALTAKPDHEPHPSPTAPARSGPGLRPQQLDAGAGGVVHFIITHLPHSSEQVNDRHGRYETGPEDRARTEGGSVPRRSRDGPERQPVHARGTARPGGPGPCTAWEGGIQPGRSPITWPGWESGSTAWVDASSAWRPGCWRRFSGGRTRKTPKPDLEYENAATVSSELGRLANADLAS